MDRFIAGVIVGIGITFLLIYADIIHITCG
jgi:hypothetical protein